MRPIAIIRLSALTLLSVFSGTQHPATLKRLPKTLLFLFFSRVGGGFVCFKNETECVDEGGEKERRKEEIKQCFFSLPRKDAYRLHKKTSINALRQNPYLKDTP